MSDDRGYDAGRDGTGHPAGLSGALHTVAEKHQLSPSVPGAEIRRLAVRRGRRRRTAVALAGVATAAAVAVTLTAGLGHDSGPGDRTTPATGPRLPSEPPPATSAAAADAVVDLTTMSMRVDGRILPVSPGVPDRPTPTGRFTVTGKFPVRVLRTPEGPSGGSGSGSGSGGAELKVPWAIELASADTHEATFVMALTYEPKAPGTYAATSGWIGLRAADAKWLYARLDKGAVVLVTGRTPAGSPTPSAPY